MKGFVYNRAELFSNIKGDPYETGLKLLLRHSGMEIMQQLIYKSAVVWLIPGNDENDLEFFYVHSGHLSAEIDGKTMHFKTGDSFGIRGIEKEIHMQALEETVLIYFSTAPVFNIEEAFRSNLRSMIYEINSKDNYTFQHSQNVMKYSVKMFMALKEHCAGFNMNNIVMASLFHDIGKIKIPDSILKKAGRLTQEEYAAIQMHPTYGYEILRPYYEQAICDLVLRHHERLDGSGYPAGAKADEISFPARIIAVADAFDAMTSKRKYNTPKPFDVAAKELLSLPEQFDHVICEKFYELVISGELQKALD